MKQVIESGDCLTQLGLDFDINNGKSKGNYVVNWVPTWYFFYDWRI